MLIDGPLNKSSRWWHCC